MILVKTCTKCHLEKPIFEFHKDNRYKTKSTRAACKVCMGKFNTSWCKTEEGKKSVITSIKKYRKSPKARIQYENYYGSEHGKLKYKIADIRYRSSKKGKIAMLARNAKRRASKSNATPPWLTKDHFKLIEMYYQLAAYMTEVTGIPHQVDHIYALNGENFKGLHVPWNLRIITKEENRWRGNKLP